MIVGISATVVALILGLVGGLVWVRSQLRQRQEAARQEAALIRERAAAEQEARRRQAETQAREEALQRRQDLAVSRQQTEDQLTAREARLAEDGETLAEQDERITAWEATLAEEEEAVNKALERVRSIRTEAKALRAKADLKVEEVAQQSRDESRETLAAAMVEQAKAEAADTLRNLETEPSAAMVRAGKRIMGISIGRLETRHQVPRQSYNIDVDEAGRTLLEDPTAAVLPTLEEALGVTCSWLNGGSTLRIETGDGVARVTARRAVETILGRRAKTRDQVEQILAAGRKELQAEVTAQGRRAFKSLGLAVAQPEIVDLVGRLYFRTSYTQNQWEHVLEAAQLAGLMAAELGLNVRLAKRATLLHDIGKALTHEIDGSHALIGAEIARRCGEPPEVAAAIEEHHDEKPISSVYSLLVVAADAISGARPGARRELVETYGERIQELERLASAFRGVTQAHAVQAGREVRVLVDEQRVNDDSAAHLASDIAQRISEELTFPGQIRVTVIREFSAVEYAN